MTRYEKQRLLSKSLNDHVDYDWEKHFILKSDFIGDHIEYKNIGTMMNYYYDKDLLTQSWENFDHIFDYTTIRSGEYNNSTVVFYNNKFYNLGNLGRFYHREGSRGKNRERESYMEINLTHRADDPMTIIKTEMGFKKFLNKINAEEIML